MPGEWFRPCPGLLTGYPATLQTFYSPVDQAHEALKAVLSAATGQPGDRHPGLGRAAEARARIDVIHDDMLKQMAARLPAAAPV